MFFLPYNQYSYSSIYERIAEELSMITSAEVKQFLRDTCEVEVAGIAPATSFSSDDKKRIVATLETLGQANQRMGNAHVFDASDFVDDAKAVIVFGRNSYFGSNPYNENDGPHGAIGNFYLNQNILNRAVAQSDQTIEFLKAKGFNAESPFTGFPQKIKALEAGIGIQGKNTLVLNKKLGSWISLSTIITDAPLEADNPLKGDCGKCTRCIDACPTGALSTSNSFKVDQCIIYYLCHLKEGIPLEARNRIGVRTGNCTVCSDVCPYNNKLTINERDRLPDETIYPELIPMMNVSEEEYETKYGATMFGFIMGGRKYLRRNIAVALGNAGDKKALPCLEIAAKDEDQLVSSHAVWAIDTIKGL
jgi:epoxyqueuosine reductase